MQICSMNYGFCMTLFLGPLSPYFCRKTVLAINSNRKLHIYSLFLIPYSFLSRAIFIFLQRVSQNHCICHIQVICWISVKTCLTSSWIIFQHLAPRFNGEIITKSGSKFCRGFSIFYFSIYVALRNDNDRYLQL